jgi:hypothetical protein
VWRTTRREGEETRSPPFPFPPFLGKIPLSDYVAQKEIEDMIWEVDENLDGCVDWEEFQLMFRRNLTDKTGLEPTQLFNVVQVRLLLCVCVLWLCVRRRGTYSVHLPSLCHDASLPAMMGLL